MNILSRSKLFILEKSRHLSQRIPFDSASEGLINGWMNEARIQVGMQRPPAYQSGFDDVSNQAGKTSVTCTRAILSVTLPIISLLPVFSDEYRSGTSRAVGISAYVNLFRECGQVVHLNVTKAQRVITLIAVHSFRIQMLRKESSH